MDRQLKLPIFYGVRLGNVLGVIAAVLIILILPKLMANTFLTHILQNIGYYIIVAIGLNIVVGYMGQVSLGHGGLFAIGAYTSALLATHPAIKDLLGGFGLPFWFAVPIAVLVTAGIGALLALPTLRAKGPYLAMVTIAFGIVVFVVINSWTDLTHGPEGLKNIPRPEWFGGSHFSDIKSFYPFGENSGFTVTGEDAYFWVIAVVALIVQLLMTNLLTGRWGRTINAVRQSEIASETVGISVYRWKVAAFALSAALAGLSGAFFAHQSGYIVSDTFGFGKSVELLVYVILGGARSLWGPWIGTAVLVVIPEILTTTAGYDVVPKEIKPFFEHYLLLYGALLILFLIAMPDGMAGFVGHWVGRFWKPAPVQLPEVAPEQRGQAPEFVRRLAVGERPALTLDAIAMHFGGVKAIDGVSLQILPGQIHGLIGPNGSGKSTVVNVVTGVYRPTGGTLRLGDQELNNLTPHQIARRGITRTFQNIQLFKDLTVIENVMAGFHLQMKSTFWDNLFRTRRYVLEQAEFQRRALELLAFLEIDHLALAEAQSLPYGLQRLVEIARALAVGPSLLLLDEPAAGVNPSEIGRLSEVIKRVREAGVTMLVIEHHMDLVMGVSDHVAALDYGKLIAEGPPNEIQTDQRVIDAYLGGGIDDLLADLHQQPAPNAQPAGLPAD